MGILKMLKAMFSSKGLIDQTIEAQEKTYAKIKQSDPSQEPHEILARVWLTRMQLRGMDPMGESAQVASMTETMQFACLPPRLGPRALGLYFVYKEHPEVLLKHPQYAEDFDKMMTPIMEAAESDRFEAMYRHYNPKMAAESL